MIWCADTFRSEAHPTHRSADSASRRSTSSSSNPDAAVVGRDALNAAVAALHEQVGGAVFRLDGRVSAHHDLAVYRWTLGPEEGPAVASEMDVLWLDDGHIAAAYVFRTDKEG